MSSNGAKLPAMIMDVMAAMGVSECRALPDGEGQAGWSRYRFSKPDKDETPVPVLLFEHKAKTISDAKRQVSGISSCIALFHLKRSYR